MNAIGKKIFEIRKAKGLTQEELAERSKVNLRTIQRIENNQNVPRGNTLNLICEVLEIDSDVFTTQGEQSKRISISSVIVNATYLILLNLVLMTIIGYLTLDSNANLNSRVGGLLLSFFIPFFIVLFTPNMSPLERMVKFGTGFLVYILIILSAQGFSAGIMTGLRTSLFPCLILGIGVLYYGSSIVKLVKSPRSTEQ